MINEILTGGVSISKCGDKWITSTLGINTTDNETTESKKNIDGHDNRKIVFSRKIRYSYIDGLSIPKSKPYAKSIDFLTLSMEK
jgi:hypothetical protein